jgi:hypothetical protein
MRVIRLLSRIALEKQYNSSLSDERRSGQFRSSFPKFQAVASALKTIRFSNPRTTRQM